MSRSRELRVSRSVDIWSYGCISSEVAVWLTYGWGQVLEYRRDRCREAQRILGKEAGDLFHDGSNRVTDVVIKYHGRILREPDLKHQTTSKLVVGLIQDMLVESSLRPAAKEVYDRSHNIIASERRLLESSRDTIQDQSAHPTADNLIERLNAHVRYSTQR